MDCGVIESLANGGATVLGAGLQIVTIILIAYVIISWVNADPYNKLVQIINQCAEVICKPIRPLASKIPGPIDWAPMIVFFLIMFLQASLVRYLANFGMNCR